MQSHQNGSITSTSILDSFYVQIVDADTPARKAFNGELSTPPGNKADHQPHGQMLSRVSLSALDVIQKDLQKRNINIVLRGDRDAISKLASIANDKSYWKITSISKLPEERITTVIKSSCDDDDDMYKSLLCAVCQMGGKNHCHQNGSIISTSIHNSFVSSQFIFK